MSGAALELSSRRCAGAPVRRSCARVRRRLSTVVPAGYGDAAAAAGEPDLRRRVPHLAAGSAAQTPPADVPEGMTGRMRCQPRSGEPSHPGAQREKHALARGYAGQLGPLRLTAYHRDETGLSPRSSVMDLGFHSVPGPRGPVAAAQPTQPTQPRAAAKAPPTRPTPRAASSRQCAGDRERQVSLVTVAAAAPDKRVLGG
jgi:hypothetical protein